MPADERCQNAGVSAGFIRSDNSSKLGVYASSHAAGRGVVALCVSYLAWNEENLLLKTQIRVEAGSLVAEETKEPLAGITHRLRGTNKHLYTMKERQSASIGPFKTALLWQNLRIMHFFVRKRVW